MVTGVIIFLGRVTAPRPCLGSGVRRVPPEVPHQGGRGRSGRFQLAEQDGDCAGGRGDVRCRSGAADPAVASRYVPGVDGLDVDRAAETPALALQAAGVTSALARPRSWAGAASRWSAPEPA